MRISDWSSDVCSSDLFLFNRRRLRRQLRSDRFRLIQTVRPELVEGPSFSRRKERTVLRQAQHERKKDMADPSPVWHPFTQHGLGEPIPLIDRAVGARLYDAAGHSWIDAISSWWVRSEEHTSEPQALMRI